MDNMTVLVVYYDGNEYKAKKVDIDEYMAKSSAPHIYGLPDDSQPIATITSFNSDTQTVWIDEIEVEFEQRG